MPPVYSVYSVDDVTTVFRQLSQCQIDGRGDPPIVTRHQWRFLSLLPRKWIIQRFRHVIQLVHRRILGGVELVESRPPEIWPRTSTTTTARTSTSHSSKKNDLPVSGSTELWSRKEGPRGNRFKELGRSNASHFNPGAGSRSDMKSRVYGRRLVKAAAGFSIGVLLRFRWVCCSDISNILHTGSELYRVRLLCHGNVGGRIYCYVYLLT